MGAAGLAMLAIGAVMPLEDWSHQLEQAIAGMGLAAGLAVFCAASVLGTLLLIPAWIFPLVAGAVFGMGWGLVAAMIAAVVSALAAFLLARYVLRGFFERAARRNKLFKSVDAAVKKDGWKVVALLRMSPVLPSGFKSYFLGLTRVRLTDYLTASAAGMLPGILLKVYVGTAGRGALTEGGALNWTIFAAGVAATVALTIIVGRKVRARLEL